MKNNNEICLARLNTKNPYPKDRSEVKNRRDTSGSTILSMMHGEAR